MPPTAETQAAVDADLSIPSPAGPLRLTGRAGDPGITVPRETVSAGLVFGLLRHRHTLRRLAAGLEIR